MDETPDDSVTEVQSYYTVDVTDPWPDKPDRVVVLELDGQRFALNCERARQLGQALIECGTQGRLEEQNARQREDTAEYDPTD